MATTLRTKRYLHRSGSTVTAGQRTVSRPDPKFQTHPGDRRAHETVHRITAQTRGPLVHRFSGGTPTSFKNHLGGTTLTNGTTHYTDVNAKKVGAIAAGAAVAGAAGYEAYKHKDQIKQFGHDHRPHFHAGHAAANHPAQAVPIRHV